MAENKTTRTDGDVAAFLAAVGDPRRRAEAQLTCELMTEATGVKPVMWGSAIVGFGSYRYRYASGRTGEWAAVGMSPRKQSLTIYLLGGFEGHTELLERLGPHTTGKSCLYVKRLDQIDQAVLRELVTRSFQSLNGKTLTT